MYANPTPVPVEDAARRDLKFGKYEGTVLPGADPLNGGRIKVQVVDVHDEPVWALPCVPYAAKELGFYMLPPEGTKVWVEFVQGDKDRAVWSGCYWSDGEIPTMDPGEMVLATPGGTIRFNSKDPKADLRIETEKLSITLNGSKLTIDAGQRATIEMEPGKTVINDGALEVT